MKIYEEYRSAALYCHYIKDYCFMRIAIYVFILLAMHGFIPNVIMAFAKKSSSMNSWIDRPVY